MISIWPLTSYKLRQYFLLESFYIKIVTQVHSKVWYIRNKNIINKILNLLFMMHEIDVNLTAEGLYLLYIEKF